MILLLSPISLHLCNKNALKLANLEESVSNKTTGPSTIFSNDWLYGSEAFCMAHTFSGTGCNSYNQSIIPGK